MEDALSATRAAVEEGIVPGGGVALVRGQATLRALLEKEPVGDERTGMGLIAKALEEPMKIICENAGQEGAVVLDKIRNTTGDQGFDAEKMRYGSMLEFGIMDPTKVTRSALENAASVAAMILTTESLISDAPQKDAPPMMPPGGGMDM